LGLGVQEVAGSNPAAPTTLEVLWLEKVPRIPRDFFVGDCCMKYWVYILHSSDEYIANLKFGIANWFDPWLIQFEIGNSHLEMSSGIRKITTTHRRCSRVILGQEVAGPAI
jgi:hypothetical protein